MPDRPAPATKADIEEVKFLLRLQRRAFKVIGDHPYLDTTDESNRYVYGRPYFNPETGQIIIREDQT